MSRISRSFQNLHLLHILHAFSMQPRDMRRLLVSTVLALCMPQSTAGGVSHGSVNLLLSRSHQLPLLSRGSPPRVRDLLQRMRGGADLVQCRFEVRLEDALLQHGDTVVLLGSGNTLHHWDVHRGVALAPTEQPQWFSANVSLPVGDSLEFKFAIRHAGGTDVLHWEGGRNRNIVVPDQYPGPLLSFAFGSSRIPLSRDEELKEDNVPISLLGMLPAATSAVTSVATSTTTSAATSPRKNRQTASAISPKSPTLSHFETPSTPERVGCLPSMITELNADKSQVATSSPDDSPATAPPSAPAAVPAPAEAVEVEREVKPDPIEAVKIQTVSDPAAVVSEVVKHTNTAVAVARNGTTTVANRKLSANLKFLAFQLLRLLFSPITVPVWIIWKSCSTTVTLISRLYLSFHAMLFETDPDKFERVLLHSIHRMEGTMRQMNSSLTNAGQKVEQQMAHVTRLEGLWQLEHERLLAAREERRSTESEFQKASREFSHELASAKKAAVRTSAYVRVRAHALSHMHKNIHTPQSRRILCRQCPCSSCGLVRSSCGLVQLQPKSEVNFDLFPFDPTPQADAEELHASEFQRASREFMNDLASAKKAAVCTRSARTRALTTHHMLECRLISTYLVWCSLQVLVKLYFE